ncbi:sialin-like isoform X1 [Cimex lectularius]|uniref:Major facilitator superfamily (MFS) profile domain-containing protein n=1 Tax=Cimex lectularius TaxID=79782 RepID=A0A8I6RN91_CIMLE|nr:sialin-like isoform X1 [Cimex lectularius]
MGKRHLIAVVCCLGLTISYLMRFCLALAITEMTNTTFTKEDPNSCPYPEPKQNTTIHAQYTWSEHQQGLILSSFFWGYVVTPIPGGLLSERFGGKTVFGGGVILTGVFTMLTPYFVYSWDWMGLIVTRVGVGLSQGVIYAALHSLVAHWIPLEERGTWGTLVFSGSHLGNTISMVATGQLIYKFGRWEMVFYLYGVLSVVWAVVFTVTVYSTPDDHTGLSKEERTLLEMYAAQIRKRKNNRETPWKRILKSNPVWAIVIAMVGHDWGMFALVTDIPKYMKCVLHFNIRQNGDYLGIGYSLLWFTSILSGMAVDVINKKKIVSLTTNRKILATIGSVGSSFGLIGASYSGCNVHVAMTCLIVGMALMGCFYPSLKVNPIDLAPNYAGTVAALSHSIGGLSGIVIPYIVSSLTPNGFLMEWRHVFWITFLVILSTNAVFCLQGSAEIQPWNDNFESLPLLSDYELTPRRSKK